MNAGPQRSMIIHFNDGSKKLIAFPAPRKLPHYAIRGARFED